MTAFRDVLTLLLDPDDDQSAIEAARALLMQVDPEPSPAVEHMMSH
jgi:hypothetical protein